MLTQEEAVEAKVLARQGKGVREIARDLGLSRNTAHRYQPELPIVRAHERVLRPYPLAKYAAAFFFKCRAPRSPAGARP